MIWMSLGGAARFRGAGANAVGNLTHRGGSCHVDHHSVADLAHQVRHLRSQAGDVNRKSRVIGFPGKLEPLPGRIDLALIFDTLTRAGLAHNFHILANAPKRPVEDSSVP